MKTIFTISLFVSALGASSPVLAQGQLASKHLQGGLSDQDWSSLKAAHESHRHGVTSTDVGFEAHNPGQNWRTEFDGQGFLVQPNGSDWSWGLQLGSFGFEGSEQSVSRTTQASADGNRVFYEWTPTVKEWFVNDSRGLEHGFTLQSRPQGDATSGPLTFDLNVRGSLVAEVLPGGQTVRFMDVTGANVVNYSGLHVFDARGVDQEAMFVGGGNAISIVVNESDAQYPLTVDPTAQQAYLKASNTDIDDLFGQAVAVSGDLVVVGAHDEDSNSTGVNGNESDNSGLNSGAAYIFRRVGGAWVQEAYLKASNNDNFDNFGWSVAVSGNRVVVGALTERGGSPGVNGDESDNGQYAAGAAYVFVESNGSWSQEAYLKASNPAAGDEFGYAVGISGDLIAVAAWNEDSASMGVNGNQADNSATRAGAAYVFRLSGGIWNQEAYLKASNTDAGDLFGCSIAVSGDLVIVGSKYEDSSSAGMNGNQSDNSLSGSGAVYAFRRAAGIWNQEAYIKASTAGFGDTFGYSVSVSNNLILVGAPGESSNATGVDGDQADDSKSQSGAAYIFSESAGVWTQSAYLKASNTGRSDNFGSSVGVSGQRVIVGAHDEDSIGAGIGSGGFGNNVPNSGSAYTFHYLGGIWSQDVQLKASAPGLEDRFGWAVAISGDLAVVGANYEDSSSTGVNGDESDNGTVDSGAAYIFTMGATSSKFCEAGTTNSSGLQGLISMSGSEVVANNDFNLHATGLPQNQIGFFLNSQAIGFVFAPGGSQGRLCVGSANSPLGRHNRPHELQNSGPSGTFHLTLDLTDIPTANGPRAIIAGETWNFQAWFRDMNPSITSNFTDGISVRFE